MARTYHTFDLIIIGGGTAGLSALNEARKYSDNILLIHDGPTGTSCARTGCMPSKSLIHAANLYHQRTKMKDAGIKGADKLEPDIPAIMKSVRSKRDYFVKSVQDGMEKHNAHILNGHARFDSPTSVRVDGKLLHTKKTIIATGSSPIIPKNLLEFKEQIITSDTLFEQRGLPGRMAVIGLGPVGLELSQALARLGITITATDHNGHIGGIADADINRTIYRILEKDMKLWTDSKPEYAQAGDSILIKKDDDISEVDALLVAVGRKPNLSSLGMKKIGADCDSDGVPYFDRRTMQIKGLPVYIAGDATDEYAILHEASDEGKRAAYHALHPDAEPRKRMTPLTITFTHPTIAIIGGSYYTMRKHDVIIGEASFENQGRATIENENAGKLRVIAEKESGIIRGCEMMAPEGEHLAHLVAFAIEQQLTAKEMLEMPFYHPSFEEGLRTALKDIARSN